MLIKPTKKDRLKFQVIKVPADGIAAVRDPCEELGSSRFKDSCCQLTAFFTGMPRILLK
jgi:hypothetical protein